MANGFIDITFEVVGQHEVGQRLATWGRNVTDLSMAWEQIGMDLLQDNALQFASAGGAMPGDPWKPLRPSTEADRIRHGYGGPAPMLQRTGETRASLTVRGAPGNVFRVRPDGVEVGSSLQKAAWLHNGTKRMEARRLVGITNQRGGFVGQAGSIVDRLNNEIKRQFVLAGLTPD
jgi:hypothetical protein